MTANDCLQLLKSIQSVAVIVFGRDLDMKVLGPNQACSASFSLRVDADLVDGIARVLCMATWRYRTSPIYPKCSVDCFGRALIVEVSASKSSVLDFVFATCCWRSGCIEVQIALFGRE